MNIEQAKIISLFEILGKLGFKPAIKTTKNAFYHYPEQGKGKRLNLHVNLEKNVWYDFRTRKGGTIVDFAVTYLEDNNKPHTVSDGLQFIETTMGYVKPVTPQAPVEAVNTVEQYTISSIQEIDDPALIEEIETKGISLERAQLYLKQFKLYDRKEKQHILMLGYEHDDEGFLVENKYMVEFIGDHPPAVTFIRGEVTGPPYIHLFKDRWDFLSLLEYQNVPALKYDALILNSYSCVPQCSGYFYKYGYRIVFTYLPNIPAGDTAIQELATIFSREANLVHRPMNSLYPPPHETLNAWWQQKKLSPSK